MISVSQYLFSLFVVLLLGVIIGVLLNATRKVEYHYRHTWSSDMSHDKHHCCIDPAVREDLREIIKLLQEIFNELQNPPPAQQLKQGKVNLMPKTIQVGGTSLATLVCLDQNGQPMTLDATFKEAYSASAPADVTVGTPNADGSATITGVAPDPGDTIGCAITRPDGVVITASPDVLTITPPPPPPQVLTSASVVLT